MSHQALNHLGRGAVKKNETVKANRQQGYWLALGPTYSFVRVEPFGKVRASLFWNAEIQKKQKRR